MLEDDARRLAERLADTNTRIVFAESCTGGLVSAALAGVPGISDWLCGSAVTYRERTKVQWLAVSESDLERWTAVSSQVAAQMARGVLRRTQEADLALSITGHFGPDAPAELDGLVFVGIAIRTRTGVCGDDVRRITLKARTRRDRQQEAAAVVLQLACAQIG